MLSGMKGKKKLLFLIPAVLVLGLLIWNIELQVELKKYKPSVEIEDAEDAIYHRDMTDTMDILQEMLKENKNK